MYKSKYIKNVQAKLFTQNCSSKITFACIDKSLIIDGISA